MLDLVQVALTRNGFEYQRIDGSRTDEQRRLSLETFRTDPRYSILLASIGSAGIGYLTTYLPSSRPLAHSQSLH